MIAARPPPHPTSAAVPPASSAATTCGIAGSHLRSSLCSIAGARVALGGLEKLRRIFGLRHTLAGSKSLGDFGRDRNGGLRHLEIAADEERRILVGEGGGILGRQQYKWRSAGSYST